MAHHARPRRAEAVAAALLCLLPFHAIADEAPDAGAPAPGPGAAAPDEAGFESLLAEPVVSAASRTAESTADAPGTTWTITGTDLKRYGIQSVEEAVRFLSHGMVSYEYDARLNAAFGARGYLSDQIGLHLAVLIDGNQAGGSAKTARGTQQYMMPIELVDHIEIVLGPGSVVYGNSAMLGVVNVVTRSAASLEGKTNFVGQVSAGTAADTWAKDTTWGEVWARAAAYGGQTFQLGGKPLDLAWHFALRWDRQQGRSIWRPTGQDPYVDPIAAYDRFDVFNRDLHTRLFARATWGKWTFLSTVAFGYTSGTGPIEASPQSTASEPEYMLDATWQDHLGAHADLSLRAYMVVFDSRATLVPWKTDQKHCLGTVGVSPCFDTLHYVNFRPFLEPIFTWDWKQDGSQVTTIGAQLFIDGSVITSGAVAADGSRVDFDEPIVAPLPNAALYAQHIWRGSHGTLNAGVRGDVGILGWAVSPRLALSTTPWTDGTVKVAFSTGFRTPSITERYLEIVDFLTSNPNIQPEHVYSAEIDLAQRLGVQHLQLAFYAALWDGLITTRNVPVEGGGRISQFANLRSVWSAGVNFAWQGASGPLDYAISLNYAPGRVRLPGNIAQSTDQELYDARLNRAALDRYGTKAFDSVLLPADGMPDFYATGHISMSWGEGLPRVSVAANLNSPRMRVNYASDVTLIDPRNVEGPLLPWTIDVRGAIEQQVSSKVGLRLTVTGRSLGTVADDPRIGDSTAPSPNGGVGTSTNPVAPVSAMAEISVRL